MKEPPQSTQRIRRNQFTAENNVDGLVGRMTAPDWWLVEP